MTILKSCIFPNLFVPSIRRSVTMNLSGDCQKNETNEVKRSTIKQVILGLLTNFSSIAPSMSLGFSAVALPVLTSQTIPNALTPVQASWFASIASLATPFGCLLSGPIADRHGRKTAMMCVNIICFLGWITIALAYYCQDHQYLLLLAGRVMTGLSTGLSSIPATIYMAEVSSPKLRGVFCTWASVSFALGVLIVYFLGFLLKNYWGIIALISAVFPCVGIAFIMFLVPESPSWLIAKDRYDEAKISMCKIYGVTDYIPEVRREIDILVNRRGVKSYTREKSLLEQCLKKIKHLLKPSCLKPFSLILTYFFFQQFSGTFVIVFYAIDIVKEAGVTLDPYVTIVMIGLVRLFAAMLVSYICKLYGRRPLSIISGTGMTLCMISLGAYILLVSQDKVSDSTQNILNFLPVLLLLTYFFTSTLGFLPLPFAMSAEVFPRKIRGTASGLASCLAYFLNFVTVKIYPDMVDELHSQGIFFFYGALSLAGTIFVVLFLPETKGKTLDEIQEYFGKKKRNSLLKPVV